MNSQRGSSKLGPGKPSPTESARSACRSEKCAATAGARQTTVNAADDGLADADGLISAPARALTVVVAACRKPASVRPAAARFSCQSGGAVSTGFAVGEIAECGAACPALWVAARHHQTCLGELLRNTLEDRRERLVARAAEHARAGRLAKAGPAERQRRRIAVATAGLADSRRTTDLAVVTATGDGCSRDRRSTRTRAPRKRGWRPSPHEE